jgi:anti-sigma factor RsiW
VNCLQTNNLLHAFLDGELDLVRHLEIEHHLAECAACAGAYEGLQSLRSALEVDALYYRAPPELAARFRAGLHRHAGAQPPASRRVLVLSAVAAGIAVLLGGVGLLLPGVLPPPADRPRLPAETGLVGEVVANHVRSLQANHLTDVPSSDRHTVKPWFKGRVDFAPAVPDLSDHNFALAGGRLDYLDGRPVVALIYRRREHVINLFLWPALRTPDRDPLPSARQGYNLLHWVAGEMNAWAVSDLNAEELREFAYLVSPSTAPPPTTKKCH